MLLFPVTLCFQTTPQPERRRDGADVQGLHPGGGVRIADSGAGGVQNQGGWERRTSRSLLSCSKNAKGQALLSACAWARAKQRGEQTTHKLTHSSIFLSPPWIGRQNSNEINPGLFEMLLYCFAPYDPDDVKPFASEIEEKLNSFNKVSCFTK